MYNTYVQDVSAEEGTDHYMVVLHDARSLRKRLGALILSRLAELRQEVVHHKDALAGSVLLI